MAYGIVELLKAKQQRNTLQLLTLGINSTDKKKGKLHQVFKTSFDCKECVTD